MPGILDQNTEHVFNSDRHHVAMPYTFGPAPTAFTPPATNQTVVEWLGEDADYHYARSLD